LTHVGVGGARGGAICVVNLKNEAKEVVCFQ